MTHEQYAESILVEYEKPSELASLKPFLDAAEKTAGDIVARIIEKACKGSQQTQPR